jgi:hypothetical protein
MESFDLGGMGTVHQVCLDLEILTQEFHREGVVGMNSAHLRSCDDNSIGLFLGQKRKDGLAIK